MSLLTRMRVVISYKASKNPWIVTKVHKRLSKLWKVWNLFWFSDSKTKCSIGTTTFRCATWTRRLSTELYASQALLVISLRRPKQDHVSGGKGPLIQLSWIYSRNLSLQRSIHSLSISVRSNWSTTSFSSSVKMNGSPRHLLTRSAKHLDDLRVFPNSLSPCRHTAY